MLHSAVLPPSSQAALVHLVLRDLLGRQVLLEVQGELAHEGHLKVGTGFVTPVTTPLGRSTATHVDTPPAERGSG